MQTSYMKGGGVLTPVINSVMWSFFEDDAGKLGKSYFRFGTLDSAIRRSGITFAKSPSKKNLLCIFG